MADNTSNFKALAYFHYYPTRIIPEVCLGLFAVATIAFTVRIYRTKSSRWLYILPGTALAEMLGYVFRTMCTFNTTLTVYILMMFFLLLPPIALALVNYKALAKIIELKVEKHGLGNDPFWLRPRFVSRFFIWSDVVTFFLQASGGGMTAMQNLQSIGNTIVIIGLAVQLFFFACFSVIAIVVARRPTYEYQAMRANGTLVPDAKYLAMKCLFVTIILLYIRNIYRFIEYATGYAGPVASREWIFYIFDFTMIFAAFITYFILFLGDYIPNGTSILRLQEAGSQEIPLKSIEQQ
ncbi:RTA1 like protein-domain-containing protein [Gongronella butleri]|nr:RTA1 like protein-domain-containing protein [Gongronella butleri]